jgi:Repeat of unknown function (DUF346)
MAPDHEHVFAQASDGGLWQKWWTGSSFWSDWIALGKPPKPTGGFIGGLATVSRSPEFCNVYVRGQDNALWQLPYADGVGWLPWEKLGTPPDGVVLNSDPVADSMAPDQEHVFVQGSNGELYQKWWLAGTWSDWIPLGKPPGGFIGGPATVSRSPEFCNVYVRGQDNALWQLPYADGVGWLPWRKVGMSSWPSQWGDVQAALPIGGPSWFPNDMSARYCVLDGWPTQQSAPAALSVTGGAPRAWPGTNLGGDYLSGGFFYWKGKNYVAQWSEPAGIRANIVHLP